MWVLSGLPKVRVPFGAGRQGGRSGPAVARQQRKGLPCRRRIASARGAGESAPNHGSELDVATPGFQSVALIVSLTSFTGLRRHALTMQSVVAAAGHRSWPRRFARCALRKAQNPARRSDLSVVRGLLKE